MNLKSLQRKCISDKTISVIVIEQKIACFIISVYKTKCKKKATKAELAEEFGVSEGAISNVANYKSWKHVK